MPPSLTAQKVACDWLNQSDRAVRVAVLASDGNALAHLIDAAIAAERKASIEDIMQLAALSKAVGDVSAWRALSSAAAALEKRLTQYASATERIEE